uniref:Uncharacterized protein n=1 Tax=Timema douglasi TaxID=61478 RepID=A0A7R8VN62_TIMDO|nr:unnamed protein product [Timema douglasi]
MVELVEVNPYSTTSGCHKANQPLQRETWLNAATDPGCEYSSITSDSVPAPRSSPFMTDETPLMDFSIALGLISKEINSHLKRENGPVLRGKQYVIPRDLKISFETCYSGDEVVHLAVVDRWYLEPATDETDSQGLHTRTLGLRLQAEKRHFQTPTRTMELRCSATVLDETWHRVISPGLTQLTNQKLAQERLANTATTNFVLSAGGLLMIASLLKVYSS